jgi:uncharacterized protein (DUF305 family)
LQSAAEVLVPYGSAMVIDFSYSILMPKRDLGIKLCLFHVLIGASLVVVFSSANRAQQPDPARPIIVQPGAPGQPSTTLPGDTRARLPATSAKDIEFMQGMIHHHAQAVEMVALMAGRTENKELRLLGARISHSQAEEMGFMRRWLHARGQSTEMQMPKMEHSHHDMPGMEMPEHLMPGMLTKKQMEALRKAKGKEFDRLFLTGMIQHHTGALTMVDELFASAGAAQDADLFNFATDVDSGQRSEIKIMQNMLGINP